MFERKKETPTHEEVMGALAITKRMQQDDLKEKRRKGASEESIGATREAIKKTKRQLNNPNNN